MPGHLAAISAVVGPVVHILLAAATTVHVLLYKRDTGAAVGWIGIAWLSPMLGSLLYFVFGINRVTRRANRLLERRPRRGHERPSALAPGRDDHLAPLERAVHWITQRPAAVGNEVTPLRSGDEAYPRMLAAIDAARASVALSTYIFRADTIGGSFIEALIRAQQRGVEVRVLIDGIGSGYFISGAFWKLRQAGLSVARFLHSPLPWRMPFLNLRTHRKILVVDGCVAFIGGLNIGDENVLSQKPPHPVRDTHFALRGPAVRQLAEVFAEDWLFTANEQLAGEAWFPPLATAGPSVARVITSGPDRDLEKIEFAALQAIACAKRSITIMTPYFLPDEPTVTALALAAMRGVDVDIILPQRSNHWYMDWAVRAHIGPLVETGCRIWKSRPPFDHSKIMSVDGLWCLIGSANWDVRSFRLNFEVDLEIYGPAVVRQVDQILSAQPRQRLTADELRNRPLARRLADAGARLLLPYL